MRTNITTKVEVNLEKKYALRAIKNSGNNKVCIAEKLYSEYPSAYDIANFIYDHNASFAFVIENYYLSKGE